MIHCNNCNATYSEQNVSNKTVCRFCNKIGYTFVTNKQKFIQFLFKIQKIQQNQIDDFNIDGLLKKDLQDIYNYIIDNIDIFFDSGYQINSLIKFQNKIQDLIKNKSL